MATIVMNEEFEAQKIIVDGFTKGITNFKELVLLAKYYRWCLGYGDAKIETELVNFCKNNDKNFNEIRHRKIVRFSVSRSKHYKLKTMMPVQISKIELEKIRSVRNFDWQKILFMMLLFAKEIKFNPSKVNMKNSQLLGYILPNIYLPMILGMARIQRINGRWVSGSRFMKSGILNEFYKLGMIEPTYTNGLRILYATDGAPEFTVDDYKNPIQYYIDWCGGELRYCSECGKEFAIKSRYGKRNKYCEECKYKIRSKRVKINVKNYRQNKKNVQQKM